MSTRSVISVASVTLCLCAEILQGSVFSNVLFVLWFEKSVAVGDFDVEHARKDQAEAGPCPVMLAQC